MFKVSVLSYLSSIIIPLDVVADFRNLKLMGDNSELSPIIIPQDEYFNFVIDDAKISDLEQI